MYPRLILKITILTLLFQACTNTGTVPVNKVNLNDTSDLSITNWKIIGPFQSEEPNWVRSGPFNKDSINGAALFEEDNFELFGLSESQVRAKDLSQLQLVDSNSVFTMPDSLMFGYRNLHGMIDVETLVNPNKPGNIYAACILKSKKEQDVVFLAGGDESARLYVNGKLYESYVQNSYRLVYQNFIFAHLNKGENFILLKISNTTKSWIDDTGTEHWRYIFNMCSPKRFNDYYQKLEKMLISKPAVPFQNPLKIHIPIHPVDPVTHVEIKDYSGNTVLTPEYSEHININSLDIGWYNLIITTSRNTYEQSFYYGDIYAGIKPYVQKSKQLLQNSTDADLKLNLGALVQRHDILYNYYMGNYFKISESDNSESFTTVDSVVTNPSRLIPLKSPNYVELETIKIWRNPIAEIQFLSKEEEGYKKLPYLQTKNKANLLTKTVKDTSLLLAPSNDAFLSELYFAFPEGEQPEYMQIITYDTLAEREIDRRFIFLYKEIRDILSNVQQNTEPFKNVPGTHLRAFTSEVEEQEQYYIVQAPESIKTDTTPKPLIVVVPWVFNDNYPFLRSFIVADIHIHEMYEWQVNLRDFLVVHSNARTYEKVVTEPLSMNNVLRTIEAVKKDYRVDTNRIHLFAYCGGSELATLLAAHYPSRFASLGIVAGFPMYPGNTWTQNTYAINFTENLTNTAIRISHGELDSHTPIQSMLQFVDIARQNGNKIEFNIEKGLTFEAYPRLRHHEEMFNFFKQQKTRIPEKITHSTAYNKYHRAYWLSIYPENTGEKATVEASITNGTVKIYLEHAKKCIFYPNKAPIQKNKDLQININGIHKSFAPPFKEPIVIWNTDTINNYQFRKNKFTEGPLLDVFSNKYILVQGTRGSKAQTLSIKNMIDKFVADWEKKYHVSPIVKYDSDITQKDILNSNLVLFGNQNVNTVFNKIYHKLPLQITNTHVILDEKEYKGTSIGFWITYPNPDNPSKYVVLVGSNNITQVIPRKGIPALNGYYDFEIYSYKDGYQYVLDNGYFNEYWKYDN